MPETIEARDLFRLYNPYTGEHFYTASYVEHDNLILAGWCDEGTGWKAPLSGDPVYRLYNPHVSGGDHHYTMDENEYATLEQKGWKQEGVAFYSDPNEAVALLREYNPYATTGTHNYTTNRGEHGSLVSAGWSDERVAWYAVAEGRPDGAGVDYSVYTHPNHAHQLEASRTGLTLWVEDPQSQQQLVKWESVPGGISKPLDPSEYYYQQSWVPGTGRQQDYVVEEQVCRICHTTFSIKIERPIES